MAPDGFDARFSALWRRYAYRLCDDPATVDPLVRGHVLAWPRRLDVDAMNEAAALLVGEHDFAAFCRKREGATTVRTLLELAWTRTVRPGGGDGARRRLLPPHGAVAGRCLVAVGEGRREPAWAGRGAAAGSARPRA